MLGVAACSGDGGSDGTTAPAPAAPDTTGAASTVAAPPPTDTAAPDPTGPGEEPLYAGLNDLLIEKHKAQGPDGRNATVSIARISP